MAENLKPTHRKHSRFHNYSLKCIYHITLVVRDRAAILGSLVEVKEDDPSTVCPWAHLHPKGQKWYERAWMNLTPLGMDVAECIHDIPKYGKKKGLKLKICAQQVMDTHLHFVLSVEEDMEDTVLGDIIRGLKAGCNKAYRKRMGVSGTMCRNDGIGTLDGAGTRCTGLFEEDFDETRLRREGQLKSMIAYVHNNPRHRWLKQHKPEWLCVTRGIVIAGRTYDAIGNVNLLGLPRHQVHCRYKWERDHDTEARRNHQNECVIKARQNYALVSPFVSPHEAAVRDFCLEEGHSVIVLHNNGFTDFSQCPGGLYDYCVMGQVLVLVPSDWPHDDRKGVCSRQECVVLNGYAEEIVNEK